MNQPSGVIGVGAFRYPMIVALVRISSMPSTTLVSYPSPPSFTQSEPSSRDFERSTPTSIRPYVCWSFTFGNASRSRSSVLWGIGSAP